MDEFLTIDGLAARMKVCRNTVKNWIARGMPVLRGGRTVRIPAAEALAWLSTADGSAPRAAAPASTWARDKSMPAANGETTSIKRRLPRDQRVPVRLPK